MRSFLSFLKETFPPKAKFSVDDIPDLTGQVMVVTGANTGIGKETAKVLLAHNAKVYIACRSEPKALEAIADLKARTGKDSIDFLKIDLSDLKSIKEAAEEFGRKEEVLHVLFNNAGILVKNVNEKSAQGYSQPFATNVLGHFYFTKLLIPYLLSATQSSADAGRAEARIVNVSSVMSLFVDSIDYERLGSPKANGNTPQIEHEDNFENLKHLNKKKSTLPIDLYVESKFANIVLSNELARRYGDQGIVSIALNPGNVASDLQRDMSKFSRRATAFFFNLRDVGHGALSSLYAGTMPEASEMNGKYIVPWARQGNANPAAQDPKKGEELWRWLEAQTEGL
ncbi:NAD(P)-binding protein [Agrocybe pediades]|nr:NAD(P)-binding protein [Agrocybe pediades]